MGSKTALISLKSEFNKINIQDGSVEGEIDLKIIESNLRILAFETDRFCINRDNFLSIVPAILLSLISKNNDLRNVVNKFLHNIKDLIAWMDYKQNDWMKTFSVDFLNLCVEKLGTIVDEFSEDWIEPWLMLMSFSLTDSEGGLCCARLNLLLNVAERAFKSAKAQRLPAKTTFHAWERFNTILSESYSFSKVINTAKVLHLLIIPFVCIKIRSADPYKHRAWFHVIEKVGLHSALARQKIVEPFFHFLIENQEIFIQYNEDVVCYIKKLCNHNEVASNYCSQLLTCIDLCIEHNSKADDVITAWSSLCGHLTMDHENFKKLLNFLKNQPDQAKHKEMIVKLCLVSYRHKLFDFKSVLFDDIRSTIEEVFPLVMSSLEFRENVFHKISCEMMELTRTLKQKMAEDEEEGCMDPILSMWEVLVFIYTDFVDCSIDSGFIPTNVDNNIISDLLLLGLSQPLTEDVSNEDTELSVKLRAFLLHLFKKSKSKLFSSNFTSKLDTDIKLSHINLKNCLWLASLSSSFKQDVNLLPLLSILCKSITGYGQPKLILEFLRLLDTATEKVRLKVNFKPALNYLRKFSSSYEPPYDIQIRQLAHNLLKRLPNVAENKTNSNNSGEVEEKKSKVRSPLTVHSNFLSRLSKAEEKKNNKNMFAASIFARGDSEKTDLNKENKQSIEIPDTGKAKPLRSDDIHLSPVSDRFAKSNAFVLDNSESSESLQSSNEVVETKMANYKISTDLHKNIQATGLSPKCSNSVYQTKEIDQKEPPLRSVVSPQSDRASNSRVSASPSTPKSSGKSTNKNKYSFLDNSSLDNQDFVFVPPKTKSKSTPLTDHQKEMLNKRREEIPALYQDLSQNTTSDLSSQDNSVLYVESKGENTVVTLDSDIKSHENDEVIKSVHDEENAVCQTFNCEIPNKDKEALNDVDELENMPDKSSISPLRLNFEGVCGNNERKQSSTLALIPTRRLGRKSTSKYRRSFDIDTNNADVEKTSSVLDSNLAEVSQKNGIASEKTDLVQSGKRRGYQKSAKIKSIKTARTKGPTLSPETLKGKLSSSPGETEDKCHNVDYASTDIDTGKTKVCSESSCLENSNLNVETVAFADSNNFERIQSDLNITPDSCEKLDTTVDHLPMDVMNSSLPSPSTNFVNVTPEITSVSTPNRRKRNKSSIKFNEFSPKMLRKGRRSIKISPKNKKIVKSINDDILINEVPVINLPDKEIANDVINVTESGIEISSVNQELPLENNQVDYTGSRFSEMTRNGDVTSDHIVDQSIEDKVEDCPKPSIISAQSKLVQKTSPNRAMRMMEMLNASDPTKSSEIKIPCSSNSKSPVKEVILKNKLVKNKGNLSRASRILKLAKKKSNLDHSELEPMSLSDAEPPASLMSPENSEPITDPSQPVFRSKRKSISTIPVSEKKTKMDDLNSCVSDVASLPKGKISSLDGWIIKKDKNSMLDSIDIDLGNGDLDSHSQTVEDAGEISSMKVEDNEKSVSVLSVAENQIESPNISEVGSTPNSQLKESLSGADPNSPRWPKRARKPKHLNISRKNQSTDNKVTPPRRKQQKPLKQQNDLSPSKVYSYENWPKGDCEAWVACEPTPPTASPSVAILKQRSAYNSPLKPQISPNATPKKRVSFLDPVVSKGLLYHKDEVGGKLQHAIGERGSGSSGFSKRRNIKLKYNYDNESSQFTDDSLASEISQQDSSKTSQETDDTILTQSHAASIDIEPSTPEEITLEIIDKLQDEILVEKENTNKDESIDKSFCLEIPTDLNTTVDDSVEVNNEMDVAKQQEETVTAEDNEEPSGVLETLEEEETDQLATPFEIEFQTPLGNDDEESPCLVDAMDIVEKVVGQVDKNQVVIVEKVEVCEGSDGILSDESFSVQDQDFEEMSVDETSEIIDVKTESFINASVIRQNEKLLPSLPDENETSDRVQSEQLDVDQSINNSDGNRLLNKNMEYFENIQIVKQEMSPSQQPHHEITSLPEQYQFSSNSIDQPNISRTEMQLSQKINWNSHPSDLRHGNELSYRSFVKTENTHSQTETEEEINDIPARCRQVNDWLDSILDRDLSRNDAHLLFSTFMSAAHRVFSFSARHND